MMINYKLTKKKLFMSFKIIVESAQKGAPDQILRIVQRSRVDNLLKTFKNKFT